MFYVLSIFSIFSSFFDSLLSSFFVDVACSVNVNMAQTLLSVLAVLLSLGGPNAFRHDRGIVGAPANTTSGLIIAHASSNRSQVSEYLEIPYAQPLRVDFALQRLKSTAQTTSSMHLLSLQIVLQTYLRCRRIQA